MVAAAPEWLKRIGERGREELPSIEINDDSRQRDEEDEDVMRADVLEFVTVGGKMPKEVYIDLMEYLVPKWDDARRE